MWSHRRCWKRRSRSIRTMGRRSAFSPQAVPSAPIWAGRICQRWRRLRLFIRAALGRLACRVRAGVAAKSELLASPGLLRCGAMLLRTLGRRRLGRAPGAAAQPTRSILCALLWHSRLRPVHWSSLRRGHSSVARSDQATRRFRRWASCADRRRGYGWKARCRQGCTRGATQGAAQYQACLDRKRFTNETRRRPRALSGRVSSGWTRLRCDSMASSALNPHLFQGDTLPDAGSPVLSYVARSWKGRSNSCSAPRGASTGPNTDARL